MRLPKPFFRKYTKSWYVEIRGRQIHLGRDRAAAKVKYQQLVAHLDSGDGFVTGVHELLAKYLRWVEAHRAPATFRSARYYTRSFAKTIGKRLKVVDLTPGHISDWITEQKTWGDTTRHEAIGHVQRAFSWAIRRRLIQYHPLLVVDEKPPRRRREVVYTPAQWQAILSHVRDQQFRDLLMFLWETGCRPIEARSIEAVHCDLEHSLVTLPLAKSKGGRRRRVIFLTDTAREICARLATEHPEGPIFRNRRGHLWTRDAMKCRFTRLRDKVGIPGMCAYAIRHSYATQGLINGVDPVTLGHLMGHVDGSMVARQYQHLAANLEYLHEAARRAKGPVHPSSKDRRD